MLKLVGPLTGPTSLRRILECSWVPKIKPSVFSVSLDYCWLDYELLVSDWKGLFSAKVCFLINVWTFKRKKETGNSAKRTLSFLIWRNSQTWHYSSLSVLGSDRLSQKLDLGLLEKLFSFTVLIHGMEKSRRNKYTKEASMLCIEERQRKVKIQLRHWKSPVLPAAPSFRHTDCCSRHFYEQILWC